MYSCPLCCAMFTAYMCILHICCLQGNPRTASTQSSLEREDRAQQLARSPTYQKPACTYEMKLKGKCPGQQHEGILFWELLMLSPHGKAGETAPLQHSIPQHITSTTRSWPRRVWLHPRRSRQSVGTEDQLQCPAQPSPTCVPHSYRRNMYVCMRGCGPCAVHLNTNAQHGKAGETAYPNTGHLTSAHQ
jgi:hypothetical protein